MHLSTVLILFGALALAQAFPQQLGTNKKTYPLRLQPELDAINVDDYLTNEKKVDLQIKCALYDGPCDAVGRWIKPRVAAAFLGQCLKCTPKQEEDFKKIIAHLQEKRPDDYRNGVIKYLKDAGVSVAPETDVKSE